MLLVTGGGGPGDYVPNRPRPLDQWIPSGLKADLNGRPPGGGVQGLRAALEASCEMPRQPTPGLVSGYVAYPLNAGYSAVPT
jgi:hypothetical protein